MPHLKTFFSTATGTMLLLAVWHTAGAQVFTNDAGAREKHFIYEVKQIDEFFERFNNDTGSFIRKAYKMYHVTYSIDRAKLLKSLFNYETKTWSPGLIDEFVTDVTLPQHTGKINFLAAGWFAEAFCKFQYNGAVIDIPVILRIATDADRRSKWIIAAIKANPLKAGTAAVVAETSHQLNFINPASHANNFIALEKAFADKAHLADYFEPACFARSHGLAFYEAVLNNRARFLYVKDITYHFLQVDNWIFTVNNFPRAALNAGWLISRLQKAGAAEKIAYLKKLLEEQ